MATRSPFRVLATDPTGARAGVLETPHGPVETPVFMPVGTHGAVKALTPDQVAGTGARILLANTYHLAISPGSDLVAKAGGLHAFMGWARAILTDSGGFQVFSLPKAEIREDGVTFRHEAGGERVTLTPERSMAVQGELGADIAMCLDDCAPWPCDRARAEEGVRRTTAWARACRAAHRRDDQALFGIVQGSVFPDLRERSAREIVGIGFDGFAIGGVSVGEGTGAMLDVVGRVAPLLPPDRPRYVMGIGKPEEIVRAIGLGADLFDCVLPTRHGRSGILYTARGPLRIRHRRYRRDLFPPDTSCGCETCSRFTRAYLRHLFEAGEILGQTLASLHNVHFFLETARRARAAILEGRFGAFRGEFCAAVERGQPDPEGEPEGAARRRRRAPTK
ncbi:MAG: tRNA guanosine(34) transglycosylase Tgt [Planctomycetales bacterium]|nr:tRNA guanosine(34) transglycosylase Tgt [Planctomycetales bacterium]